MRTPLRTLALAIAFVLGVSALGACAAPNRPPGSARMSEIAGFSPGGGFISQDDATILRELDAIHRTGATWIRIDFGWSWMEPSPGTYQFAKYDRVAAWARARGIRIIALVAYTPPWARPSTCRDMKCGPADPAAYARFLKRAVSHFSPLGVKHYEIWNEPNQYFWWKPKPSPRAYTALLRAAYPAAKSADRGVTIIAGAFAPAPDSADGRMISSPTFTRNLYANGARSSFDAISIHPYMASDSPYARSDWNMMSGVMPRIHATMQAHGDGGKKIWGTEFGYVTDGPKAVGEATQGTYIQQGYKLWTSFPYTAGLMTFTYRDMGTDRRVRANNFGLVRRDWSPKASLRTFTETMQIRQS